MYTMEENYELKKNCIKRLNLSIASPLYYKQITTTKKKKGRVHSINYTVKNIGTAGTSRL